MLSNCGVGGDSWERPLDYKEIKPVSPKGNQSWIVIGRTDAEAETPILWLPDVKNWLAGKRPWCWERLKAGGEGDDKGWDGWMALPIQETWLWVSSGSWWWTGKPGMLQFIGSDMTERLNWNWNGVGKSDMTEWLNWTEESLRISSRAEEGYFSHQRQ